ncbi:MAG: DUF4226 domain-containing protein [Mycobacterium sp.]
MAAGGESADALEAARRALAARDADLAAADRALADAVAGAYAAAVESIGRIEAIESEVEAAAADQPKDTPAGAREFGRHLVAVNREAADVVRWAKAQARAKTVAVKELTERYLPPAPS